MKTTMSTDPDQMLSAKKPPRCVTRHNHANGNPARKAAHDGAGGLPVECGMRDSAHHDDVDDHRPHVDENDRCGEPGLRAGVDDNGQSQKSR